MDVMLIYRHLASILRYNDQNKLDVKLKNRGYQPLFAMRRTLEFLIIALIHYSGLNLGVLDGLFLPILPSCGVMLGLLFLRGRRIIPGIFLGALFAFWQAGFSWFDLTMLSSLHTLGPWLMYEGLLKTAGPCIPLSRFKTFLRMSLAFIILGLGLGYISALAHFHAVELPFSFLYSLHIMMSFLLGITLFVPVSLIWDTYIPDKKRSALQGFDIAFIGLVLGCFSGFCFATNMLMLMSFYVACLSLLFFASFRYQQIGVVAFGLLMSFILLSFETFPASSLLKAHFREGTLWLQSSFLTSYLLSLGFATFMKEHYFQTFIRHHPSLRND